jgi:geranylgeranyl diphosphate synthase type I
VERPLHLGAALSAPKRFPEMIGPLSAVGLPLGEAFQLRDDLLGVFGDPAVTGKPVGDDLREGKPTLLASLAWARLTGGAPAVGAAGAAGAAGAPARSAGPQARFFEDRFGAPDLTDDEIAQLRAVMEDTGARRDVEATIEQLADAAERALERLPLTAAARDALRQLAAFTTGRDC